MSGQPFPYSQTILLDCNRRESVEFSASNLANTNTAIFSNQVSSGITLDIGDQVSIQSAHIAARGAGGSIIEFSGKSLGTKNIEYTQQTNTSFVGTDEFFITDAVDFSRIQTTPEGFALEENENITEEIKEYDNEANLVISYYKNTNGENYIGLPRNFGNASSHASAGAHGGTKYWQLTQKGYWEVKDGYPVGANTFMQNSSHVYQDDWYEYDGYSASGISTTFRKIKNDNSRFTLFKQKFIVWNSQYVSDANASYYLINGKYSSLWSGSSSVSDPAAHDYIKLKKKINLSVPVGFNSPQSVAADLTNQLTETEDPVFIDPSGVGEGQSVYVNSTTNRAIPACNYTTFSGEFNAQYFNADYANKNPYEAPGPPNLDMGENTNKSTQYLNSYAYVGFKRPEIVETGRLAFNGNGLPGPHGGLILDKIVTANASTAVIGTDLPWTEENLLQIKDFFEAQALYPDLLKSPFTSDLSVGDQSNYSESVNPTSSSLAASFAEEARYVHIDLNKIDNTSPSDYTFDPIGDDMYNVSAVNGSVPDISSTPLFIAYNKNSSHLTSSQSNGTSYENLVYGFATRYNPTTDPTLDKIGFTTEKIGGIPSSYFSKNNGCLSINTPIGYDWHFNGFGNAAILPSSGFFPLQYFGQQQFLSAKTCRQAYIGANDPVFKFNDVEGRFEFEQLHTAERVGNFYNAGDPDPSAAVFGPPETGQAGENCYKIDKQLHYTTWSPHMFGYSSIVVKENASTGQQKSFVKVNENLEIGRIYDSHGGVFIEDMGYNEKDFNQGFWGLCGFEFGQFNSSGNNQLNGLIKYTNNTENANVMTTNADIQSVDSQSYINNVYGANLFSQQLSSRIAFHNTATSLFRLGVDAPDYKVSPAATILANSTRITANELPRRILRGYFLINSDILDQANFFQTANPLQTMAMVGKYNGANDFIQYDGGGAVFTCTRKKTITSIKTEILDPEGGLAQVGDNSGVVYRIDKQINTDLKFAENLFAEMNSKN